MKIPVTDGIFRAENGGLGLMARYVDDCGYAFYVLRYPSWIPDCGEITLNVWPAHPIHDRRPAG